MKSYPGSEVSSSSLERRIVIAGTFFVTHNLQNRNDQNDNKVCSLMVSDGVHYTTSLKNCINEAT